MNVPKIMMQEKRFTILIALDGEKYCAYCPELDLVTEMDTPEEAAEDIFEAMKDYANEYIEDLELYSVSPNRAHHLPYVKTIYSCNTDWELKMMTEINYGVIYV
ncbi:MAG: hypothetical protein HQK88_07150 [Nitrospirae bacterium]|nr:hypothetical protein [Nitrospirota bacterium]MBF0535070.1 hypothetical protein [Nitrospirota bacterium]MBF0616578.1 hypothetical protein [Nitrospirota bacterium]